jgi:parallel beta-helix repeat protein
MEYYSAGAWNLAAITLGTVGNPGTLCGNIPASALTETHVAIGDPTSTFYISPSATLIGGNTGCNNPFSNTIGQALQAAPPGSVIIVCPGTYNEQLSITKSLTLEGSGASSTTIEPSTLVADSFGLNDIVTVSGSAVTVSISGFTISGEAAGATQTINNGIFAGGGAAATISDNTITYISQSPITGAQSGRAIQVGISGILDCSGGPGSGGLCTATAGAATITGNTILDYQKSGILIDGPGSSATITGNTVTGVGAIASAPAQNGIEVTFGASATVSDNTVSGNIYTGSGYGSNLETQNQACGVLTYSGPYGSFSGGASGTVQISGNTLTGNDLGVCLYYDARTGGTDTVTSNTVSSSTYVGVVAYDEKAAVTDNIFSSEPVGIEAFSDSSNSPAAVTVGGNAYTSVTTPITTGTSDGGTAQILGTISVCSSGCDYTTIQAAVDAAGSGATINVGAGTYNENVIISKSLTLQSTSIPANTILNGAIQLSANSVNVAGFKINGGTLSALVGTTDVPTGIYVVGGTSGHTIQNNIITGNGFTGASTWTGRGILFGYGVTNVDVSGNEISGWLSGVYINPSSNLDFSDNTIHNNYAGIGSSGISNVNIIGNTFTDNTEAFGSDTVGTGVQVHQNKFQNNAACVDWYSGTSNTIDASMNWWGTAYRPTIVSLVSGLVTIDPYYISSSMTTLSNIAPSTVYVSVAYTDGSANGHVFGYDAFSNIQDGINAVGTGGTVNIADGTYTITAALEITKDGLTITGTSQAGTIIDASTDGGYGIHVQANYISLQTFTLLGPTANTGYGYGIKIEGINPTTKATGISLAGVTVKNSYKTGIDLNGIDGATLSNIVVTNSQHGTGLAITDSDNVHFSSITTKGNGWGAIAIYVKGAYYPGGSSGVTIDGTNTFGEGFIYAEIDNTAYHITNLKVNPSDFPYFTSFPDLSQPTTIYYTTLASAVTGALTDPTHSYITSTTDGSLYVAPGLKIQNAIAAASPGGTVNVAAGTYDEQIILSQPVTLEGAGGTTIIRPSQTTANSFQLFERESGTGAYTAAIIVANAAGGTVNVMNLKVDGSLVSSLPSTTTKFVGILYRNTGGLINSVTVTGINVATGDGIYLSGGYGTSVSVEVENSAISNFAKNGITANFDGLAANIHGNTVTGPGSNNEDPNAGNGIQIAYGATGSISHNTVENLVYTGSEATEATGILVFESSNVNVNSNVVTNNQAGIVLQTAGWSSNPSDWVMSNDVVSSNTISYTSTYSAPGLSSGSDESWGVYVASYYQSTASVSVSLSGNTINGQYANPPDSAHSGGIPSIGIQIGDTAANGAAGSVSVTATADTISGWVTGLLVAPSASSVSVSTSSLGGNTAAVTNANSLISVNAADNWWGTAYRPTIVSLVSGPVSFDPYYVNAAMTILSSPAPSTVYVNSAYTDGSADNHIFGYDAFSRIQDAVNEVSSGGTVNVAAGTYDEQVVISKSLTLQGAGATTIVKPSSAATLTQVFSGLFWQGSPSTKQVAGIIVANVPDGSSVTITSLTVDESSVSTKPTGADYLAGIFYRETGGTVNNVDIVGTGAWSGTDRAYGMYLSAATNAVSVEVKNSVISNFDKNGIEVMGSKLSANIHNNTITGRGSIADEVQNGVNVGQGATATVNSNIISNLVYQPLTWWATGVLFVDSGPATANGNTITNAQIGVMFQNSGGSAQGNTVNCGTGGAAGLLGLWAQYLNDGVQSGAGTWTVSFTGNTVCNAKNAPGYYNGAMGGQTYSAGASLGLAITANTLTSASPTDADGIVVGDAPANSPAGNIVATITGNTISGWQNGVDLLSSVAPSSAIGSNTISGNSGSGINIGSGVVATNAVANIDTITSNGKYAVSNAGTGTFGASNNWWGTAYRPTITALISGSVTFDPYYVNPAMTILSIPAPSTVYVDSTYSDGHSGAYYFGYNAFSKIQDGVNGVSPSGTVNVAAGTYDESQITINKGLTLQGAGSSSTFIDGGSATLSNAGLLLISHITATVTVDGFTFQNAGTNSADGEIADVVVSHTAAAAPVIIRNSHFIGRNNGNLFDNGIWSYSTDGSLTIQNNEFEKMWQAVLLELPRGGATVQGNTFHNLLPGFDGVNLYEAMGIFAFTYNSENVAAPIVISGNTFRDFSGSDISVGGGYTGNGVGQFSNVQITDNTINAIGSGQARRYVGIILINYGTTPTDAALSGVPGAVISGNTITGTGSTGNGNGIWLNGPSNDVSIQSNSITGVNEGIVSDEKYAGAGFSTGTVAHYNSFGGNAMGVSDGSTDPANVIDATNNWWGSATGPNNAVTNPSGTGDVVSANVIYSPWLGASVGTRPMTFYVNPTGKIQNAINAASPGDTVSVSAGTYDEQIILSQSVTLEGAGSTTVIRPSQTTANSFQLFERESGTGAYTAAIIVANAAGGTVNVMNLKVDGSLVSSVPSGATLFAGIFYRNTNGLIDSVTVTGMNGASDLPQPDGIYLSGGYGSSISVEVRNSVLSSFLKNGITANFDGLTANIHDNTVTGLGNHNQDPDAGNGIQIGYGATGSITHNTVGEMIYTDTTTGWAASGVLVWESSNVNVNNNILTNDQTGILLQTEGTSSNHADFVMSNDVVSGNTISYTSTYAGPGPIHGYSYATWGIWPASYCSTCSVSVSLSSNTINGQNAGAPSIGIQVGDTTTNGAAGSVSVTATADAISGWATGILAESGSPTTMTVHASNLAGNIAGVVTTGTSAVVDARGNWWGSPSGPLDTKTAPYSCGIGYNNPSGTGSSVSSCVAYRPWLYLPITITPSGLALDQSFSPVSALTPTTIGTIGSVVNATWINSLSTQQVTGIVWFQVENSLGQTVMIAAPSLTLSPGQWASVYLGLATLSPGQYTVDVFVTTVQGVPISQTQSTIVTITVR